MLYTTDRGHRLHSFRHRGSKYLRAAERPSVNALEREPTSGSEIAVFAEYQTKETTIIDLCRQFGISQPTAYRWIKRYEELGPGGSVELSRRPKSCSHAIPEGIENEVLAVRRDSGNVRHWVGAKPLQN